CQGGLECGIQQLMTVLAQKHEEFACFACTGGNVLFFRGQRNRRVPHRGLLQMGGACSSAITYKSTASPVVSTLSELLSKQLISVLDDVVLDNTADYHSPDVLPRFLTMQTQKIAPHLSLPEDFFHERLAHGRCIVLLDGLDEVADPRKRA